MKLIILCILIAASTVSVDAQRKITKPEIGIVSDLKNESLLHSKGLNILVESISKLFSPKSVNDSLFDLNLQKIRTMKMKLYAVNIFLPGDLKVVGSNVNEPAILDYAKVVFDRCQRAGVTMLVWGSGGSRRIPDGYDRAIAREQFISIAKKIARLGAKYNVRIVLENLNRGETNFINTVAEASAIVRDVNNPNFKLCVDIYHMLRENESPEEILKSKQYIVHCDIAEKEGRRPPGTKGDDFTPYLMALRKTGYNKKIIIECEWKDLKSEVPSAKEYLQKQVDEVYK